MLIRTVSEADNLANKFVALLGALQRGKSFHKCFLCPPLERIRWLTFHQPFKRSTLLVLENNFPLRLPLHRNLRRTFGRVSRASPHETLQLPHLLRKRFWHWVLQHKLGVIPRRSHVVGAKQMGDRANLCSLMAPCFRDKLQRSDDVIEVPDIPCSRCILSKKFDLDPLQCHCCSLSQRDDVKEPLRLLRCVRVDDIFACRRARCNHVEFRIFVFMVHQLWQVRGKCNTALAKRYFARQNSPRTRAGSARFFRNTSLVGSNGSSELGVLQRNGFETENREAATSPAPRRGWCVSIN